MKKEKKVRISVQGEGLSYEAELDQRTAGQVIAICLSSVAGLLLPNKLDASRGTFASATSSHESASEFYNRHAPTTNPGKILTLAGYLKEMRNVDSFHPNEIKSLFRDVAEVLPANFNRDVKSTIQIGWIAPDLAKKANFYVTNTGMKILAEGFSKVSQQSVNKGGGRRKKKSTRK